MSKISILVPVYNESAYVTRCLENIVNEDLGSWEKEIIVVNDGSTDKTSVLLQKFKKNFLPITILSHQKNRGKGAAIKAAAAKASGDILIIQDADLEYDPNDYHVILEKFKKETTHVVYGSRILGSKIYKNFNSNIFFYYGGVLLTKYINILFKTNLTDQTTCYKAWRSELTKGLIENCPSNGFEFEIEMTAYFSRKHAIAEVPIRYYPRAISHGKKIGLKDFFLSIFTAFRCRFNI